MKICALETHSREGSRTSAVDYWRVVNPLKHTDLDVTFKKQIINDSTSDSIEASWKNLGKTYDVLYTSYIDTLKPYAYLKAIEEKYGLIHIMDLDDNLYEIDEMSPSYLAYNSNSQLMYKAMTIINDAQFMTVATPELKTTLERYGRLKPTFVMPNYIDSKLWEMPKPEPRDDGKVNIVYQGSSTHYSDINKTGFLEACIRLHKKHGKKIHFYFMGMVPMDFSNRFPRGRVEYIQGESDYFNFIDLWKKKRVKFDIGVAPLVQSSFNDCKSEIKYYEGGISYLPMVLSSTPNYLRVTTDGVNGFLANNTPDEWFDRLDRLVESYSLRKTMGEMAHKNVVDNYTIENKAYLWEELLSDVMGRKR